jgi:hypothetical protein
VLSGGIVLEEAVDLSSDRLLMNNSLKYHIPVFQISRLMFVSLLDLCMAILKIICANV